MEDYVIFKYLREFALFVAKKLPFMKSVVEKLRKLSYRLRSFKIIICSIPRRLGFPSKKYKRLLEFKDKHKGQRCFIIATGPSLTYSDLDMIKDEITFSMNSIILSYNQTSFRPTYYGIQDTNVYKRLYPEIIRNQDQQISFYSDGIDADEKNMTPPKRWIPICTNGQYHFYEYLYEPGNFFARFSSNAYAMLYDGYSITYTLIELAVYMGVKEIYLLGCDSTYSPDKNKQHFIESGQHDPEELRKTATDRLTVAYKKAKDYTDKHGVKIYNATRGGVLEVFPRVNLDDVLSPKPKLN